MSPNALIFDFDGLILDTETPIFQAWRECYRDHGHDLALKTYARCVGTDFADYNPATELEKLVGRALPWEELNQRRRDRVDEVLQTEKPMPGVADLLEQARQHAVPCAVASSSSRAWVEGWLGRLGLLAHFQAVITLDDVERPKPSPELFQLALRKLAVPPDCAVVFEDSLNGLRAARAAEIPCAIVPNRITAHLNFEDATLKVASLEAISVPEVFRQARCA